MHKTYSTPKGRYWTIVLLLMLIQLGEEARIAVGDEPLNVVLMMTDDQGYGDIGAHGNSIIQTPNLDALAEQSIRFTNFHVDPTCSETRAALMTGRYSCRIGVWHTVMGRSLLRSDEKTMADVFSANGYRTGIFGKWHLGDCYPFRPQDRGFQETLVHGGGGAGNTPDYWGNDYFDDTYFRNGEPEKQSGYCTDVFFDAGIKFIEQHKERPFFCYIPTNAPHSPFLVDEKYSQPYLKKNIPPRMAQFYGMVTNIDENLGRLIKRLSELGLRENTLLFFMTDNGTDGGFLIRSWEPGQWPGFNAGMRAKKASQYEGGHRVPLYLNGPKILGNSPGEIDTLTANIDLLPTLVDLCGLQLPKSIRLDGRSLRPLLSGSVDWTERTLVVHSQRLDHPQKWRKSAVMTQDWRLINGKELYRIADDPGQQNDVASEHLETVAHLRSKYEQWWDEVSQRFDEYVRIPVGNPMANPTTVTCHDWHSPIEKLPWDHNRISLDPQVNGFWAIDVHQPGRYAFTLRSRPAGVPHIIGPGSARTSRRGGSLCACWRERLICKSRNRTRKGTCTAANMARRQTIKRARRVLRRHKTPTIMIAYPLLHFVH